MRALRERVRRQPENFAAFLGELHGFLKELYENAARAAGEPERFAAALADLCRRRGLVGWEDVVTPDRRHQFFKDAQDPDAADILAFWAELDEPLDF